jgi:hypothetical protein
MNGSPPDRPGCVAEVGAGGQPDLAGLRLVHSALAVPLVATMSETPWIGVLQGVLIVLLGWLGRMVGLVLKEVRLINDRITRLEAWKETSEQFRLDHDRRMTRLEDRDHDARRPA